MPLRKTTMLTIPLASPLLGLAQNTLSLEDVAKVRMVHKKYEETWLRGDADGVRALFTDDSVLLPPHAGKPWLGHKGLNDFLVPAQCTAHQNHQARCHPGGHRRR